MEKTNIRMSFMLKKRVLSTNTYTCGKDIGLGDRYEQLVTLYNNSIFD